jgi:tRNA-2-methylthio-N6-dimethylallyladenosine synthase
VQRLHWTAPHPIFMTEEVIDALTLPCQLNFLHLPVQSGNNEVLKRMNRRHTREFYIDLIDTIRQRVPDIAIGTDIIVGFAGETRPQFQDTVSLFKACDFDISYTAQYSERSGTLGAKMFRDDVSTQEKKRRWHELQGVMEQIVLRKNQQYVDMVVSVLVDSVDAGWCMGNSREMKRVRFKGDASHMGKVVSAQVYKAQEWMLHARPVVSP